MTTETNSVLSNLLGGMGPNRGPNPADYPFLANIILQKAQELAQPNADKKEVDDIIVTAWLKKIERLLEWRNGQRVLTEEGEAYFEVSRGPTTTTDTVTFLEVQLKSTICEKVKKMLELHKYSDLVEVLNKYKKSTRLVFDSILYPIPGLGGITGGTIAVSAIKAIDPNAPMIPTLIAGIAGATAQNILIPALSIIRQSVLFTGDGIDLLSELFDGADPATLFLQQVYRDSAGPWQDFYLGSQKGFEIKTYGEVVEGLEKAWKKIPCGVIGPTTGGPSYRQIIFETIGLPPSSNQPMKLPDIRPYE